MSENVEKINEFFSDEGMKLGYTFTEDMPIIFEDFKMVFSQ